MLRRRPGLLVLATATVLLLGAGLAGGSFADPGQNNGQGQGAKRVCPPAVGRDTACGAQVVTDGAGTPLAGSSPVAGSYGPAQFHTAYALPTNAPSAQTIGIVDAFDDPNIAADLAAYETQYGLDHLPPCSTGLTPCFGKFNQSGGTSGFPAADSGWSLEIALDVETAREICQNCSIYLVEANDNFLANLGAAVNTAAWLGADVISNSYGAGEYSSETADENAYFNHPGVVITASSGDGGYGVEFPAASQYVTAVGGTTLTINPDNTWAGETVWSGSGSGCSQYEPKPSWQHDSGCVRRTVADVSADADPATGAAVFDSVSYQGQSGWFKVGGTSLAAPLIAAVYALTGTGDSSTPYSHAASLHDVISGKNTNRCTTYLCKAQAGYDGPTGLGTPNGLTAFSYAPPTPEFTLAVSPASQTVIQGSGANYTVTVTPTGGYSNSVSFTSSGLPAGATATFAPPSSQSGSSLAITTTALTPTGTYPFTITATGSDNLSHTVPATLIVNAPPPKHGHH